MELSVKAPPVGGLVWSFVVTFDVRLLREFLLDCGLHSGQSDNFRQSPTHFLLFLYIVFFLVNMILSNHIHLADSADTNASPQIGGDAFILLPRFVAAPSVSPSVSAAINCPINCPGKNCKNCDRVLAAPFLPFVR